MPEVFFVFSGERWVVHGIEIIQIFGLHPVLLEQI
jgi:hypothetical protein